jgi:hypothetical protein
MGTSIVPPAGGCKITPTPLDPNCPFKAVVGPATIEVVDVVGTVQFLTAEYDGQPILGTPSKQITFTVVAGKKNLDLVFSFVDPPGDVARGIVQEVCPGKTFLGDARHGTPPVRHVICA